ncbi:MAG: sensor histidine kinase [Alphaproteobacteria bacterium]|nr:sensor histidine kinase [Alphaproteobacteria bacterium]
MGYGQRLRVQKNADIRVLRAELDLIAGVIRSTRYTSPMWALAISWLASSSIGVFGNAGFTLLVYLPILITAVMFVCAILVSIYQIDTARSSDAAELQPWFGRIIAIQSVISASWGLMPWLLWEHGSSINHLFLAGAVVTVLSSLVASRANHKIMLLATLVPMVSMSAACFALSGTWLDLGIAAFFIVYGYQLFHDGRRLSDRMEEDSRLRFEVEDLARDLEEARDEALHKRFEAETANASKTAFLANMSHELRTPLNAILGFSEIIAQECFGPVGSPRYKEYAGDIHSSGAHLLSLINDLLDVAKIEAGRMEIEPELLDARQALDIALKLVGAKARERNQRLVIEIHDDAPKLYADERALKQILINLASNAVKFTPEGGLIRVVGSKSRCGSFQIMVEDNGPGIPRDKLDKIFKPFSQVNNRYDRQGGGTGLGLALVRGLTELHGGRAWLESEQGHGCRAFVLLPAEGQENADGINRAA